MKPQRRRARTPRKGVVRSQRRARVLIGDGPAAGLSGVALLIGSVARAHERTGEDRAEAERLALLAQPAELVGMNPAVDGGVLRAGLQVLADRDDVDAVGAEVAHRLDDLLVGLAETDDEPGLRQHAVVRELLGAAEEPKR